MTQRWDDILSRISGQQRWPASVRALGKDTEGLGLALCFCRWRSPAAQGSPRTSLGPSRPSGGRPQALLKATSVRGAERGQENST